MKRIFLLFAAALVFGICAAFGAVAAETVEAPADCNICGMNRTAFSQSRVLIEYEDGTKSGTCSINCAAADMKNKSGKKARSIAVADYDSSRLIDAKSANWVLGGSQAGVMTTLPKWAFASVEGARKFVQEYGGKLASFEQVMLAVNDELTGSAPSGGGHMSHDMGGHMGHDMGSHMGPGAQLVFNPAFGDDIYHTHPAGMWMVNYKFMHQEMNGLQDGTRDVPVSQVSPQGSQPYGFMMTPTRMTMDMQMLMLMYGVTDRLTLMAMANYMSMSMDMLMNMGSGNVPEAPMRTSGFGDTELRAIYGINKYLVASLGLNLPTGDTHQEVEMMNRKFRAPYDMQLGSGTFDLKPALTYNGLSEDALWNWGGQVSYTYRPGNNDDGYSLGNNVKVTSWLQRAIGPASAWLRLTFNDTGRIHGRDSEIAKMLDAVNGASMPDADPANYGGQRLDGLLGVSYAKGAFSAGIEGGIPLFQDVNGLQLVNDWYLTAGVQMMF